MILKNVERSKNTKRNSSLFIDMASIVRMRVSIASFYRRVDFSQYVAESIYLITHKLSEIFHILSPNNYLRPAMDIINPPLDIHFIKLSKQSSPFR